VLGTQTIFWLSCVLLSDEDYAVSVLKNDEVLCFLVFLFRILQGRFIRYTM